MKITNWYCCECKDVGGDLCFEVFSEEVMDARDTMAEETGIEIFVISCGYVPEILLYMGSYNTSKFYGVRDETTLDKK